MGDHDSRYVFAPTYLTKNSTKMALYMMIVFNLLMLEMALFCTFIVPMPFSWRRKMFKFISESPTVARMQYGLKILFLFVGVLFVDALQHMIKIHREGQLARETGNRMEVRAETDWRSRKFLSERNMYLTGSTLFLSLILTRTYHLILDLIKAQEDVESIRNQSGATNRSDAVLEQKLKALQKDYDELAAKQGNGATSAGVKKDI